MKLTTKFKQPKPLDQQICDRFNEIGLPNLNALPKKAQRDFAEQFYVKRRCLIVTKTNGPSVMDCKFI